MYKQYTDREQVDRIRAILSNIISVERHLRDLVSNLKDTHAGHLIEKACSLKGRTSIYRAELIQLLGICADYSQKGLLTIKDEKTRDQVNRILKQATGDINEILDQDSDIPIW